MSESLLLVSHKLCPFVQRAVILLKEKNVSYRRRDIDLANKPDWFKAISPLGKTPVLLVNDQPIFESAVICEYLEESFGPALHPADPLARARHRSWVEFSSAVLNLIAGFYSADTESLLHAKAAELRASFSRLEEALGPAPWFDGDRFSVVDAAFGPVFRYFDVIDTIGDFGTFAHSPKLVAWRASLAGRRSVRSAVDPRYPQWLRQFFLDKRSALTRKMLQAG